MFRPDGVRSLVRKSGAQMRNLMLRKGADITVRAVANDRLAIARPPLMTTNLFLGEVDLSDLGMWFHYRPAAQNSRVLGMAIDAFIDFILAGDRTRTAANKALAMVAGHGGLAATPKDPELASLITAMYLPAYDGHGVKVTHCSIRTVIEPHTFEYTPRNLAGLTKSRIMRSRVNPMDLLTAPYGAPVVTTAKLGAVYQHALSKLPEFHRAITAIVAAAAHGDMADVLVDAFDTHMSMNVVLLEPTTAWDRAIRLVETSDEMPYHAVRDVLRDLIGGTEFQAMFGTVTNWTGRAYSKRMREKHLAELIARRSRATEPARLSSQDATERASAERLLQQQHEIR